MKTVRKTAVKWAAVLALMFLTGCSGINGAGGDRPNTENSPATPAPASAAVPASAPAEASVSPSPSSGADVLVYQNSQYGFRFTLPEDWKGYSIVESKWEGLASAGDSGDKIAETGPILSIRDPRWTQETPRQDIPVMVFTLEQWDSLQKDEFHIGAAPIGPSELGRNNKYVFALPARYNFAFPEGYEEVEAILKGDPLQADQAP